MQDTGKDGAEAASGPAHGKPPSIKRIAGPTVGNNRSFRNALLSFLCPIEAVP